ncbi:DUF6585 family protein [Nocardia sp. NPDC056064]|uniref:DUF6585 family protein n=1 Tax=Nocardia sp. NPDC056064 TaxID=3345701 RepID=UPI0035DD7B3B
MGTELRGIQNREKVPAEIEKLAQSHRLGRLREVFGPYQRWVFTRLNGARLYVYEDGLAFTGDHAPVAFAWRSTSVWNYKQTINGGISDDRWVLVGPDDDAYSIGRGGFVGTPRIDGRRITGIRRGAPFVFEGVWGPEVQAGIARAQLPAAWADLQRGEILDFQGIAIGATELRVGSTALPWSRLEKAGIAQGMLCFTTSAGKGVSPVGVQNIRNLGLVLTLFEALRDLHRSR